MSILFGGGGKKQTTSDIQRFLTGIRIQTSLIGVPIPIPYGLNRMTANIIGYWDFRVIPHVTTTGGKGGLFGGGGGGGGKGSQSQTTYTYQAAVALALGEGVIEGIDRMWDSQGHLPVNDTTEDYVVPGGGGTYSVVNAANYYRDILVVREDAYSVTVNDYGSDGPFVLGGTQFTPMVAVGSSPGADQYVSDGAGNFTFSAADGGKTVRIEYLWTTPNTTGSGAPLTITGLTLFPGDRPQSPWGYLVSAHPADALAYVDLAYVATAAMDLGSSGILPNLSFEVRGAQRWPGAGGAGCIPFDVIADFLCHARHGAGWLAGELDASVDYVKYVKANGLMIAPFVDQQRAASDHLSDWLAATNSEAVWSSGKLKFVPYGDRSVVGNGAIFNPPTQPLYDLDDDDFAPDAGEAPVTVERPTVQDAYNSVQVEFNDRANNYNSNTVEARDQRAVELYGLRPLGSQSFKFITNQNVAAMAAQTMLSRLVNVRNIYQFKTTPRYIIPDVMDLLTITDVGLGLSRTPVRIKTIKEMANGKLQFTAEEFPWSASAPTLYPKQPIIQINPSGNAVPEDVNPPVIFEALARLNGFVGRTVMLAVSSADINWGGCRIWVSADGTTYTAVGDMMSKSRTGKVRSSTFPSHADPDTANTLHLDLSESDGSGDLLSGTVDDADNYRTLCFVDGELISYQDATLVGTRLFDLGTRIRRGVFGSPIGAHAVNSQFCRIDDTLFSWEYDPTLIGTTVYFKFTSFNTRRAMEQSLAGVTAYPFVVTGKALGLIAPAHITYKPDSNPLTGHDAGLTATINIAAFNMVVPGFPLIPESSGSIPALAYDTTYYVYFDDPHFDGGTNTYVATTNKDDIFNAADRFFVGSCTTPRAGAPDTIGNDDGGSGSQVGTKTIVGFSSHRIPTGTSWNGHGTRGTGAVSIPYRAYDGDPTSYAELTVTGDGGDNEAMLIVEGVPARRGPVSSAELHVIYKYDVAGLSFTIGATLGGDIDSIFQDDFAFNRTVGLDTSVPKTELITTGFVAANIGQGGVNLSVVANNLVAGGTISLKVYDMWLVIPE